MRNENCGDNRFEVIEKYKAKLIEAKNIEQCKDEMDVIDSILFRFWQMGWLDILEKQTPKKPIIHDAGVDVLKELGTVMTEETECPWCYKHSRKGMIPMKKHEMEWGVIDEDFGQYVHLNMIHYCPFCGRSLDGTD